MERPGRFDRPEGRSEASGNLWNSSWRAIELGDRARRRIPAGCLSLRRSPRKDAGASARIESAGGNDPAREERSDQPGTDAGNGRAPEAGKRIGVAAIPYDACTAYGISADWPSGDSDFFACGPLEKHAGRHRRSGRRHVGNPEEAQLRDGQRTSIQLNSRRLPAGADREMVSRPIRRAYANGQQESNFRDS